MKPRDSFSRFFIFFVFAFLIFSCRKEETEWQLEVPPTPIMTGTIRWGVVNTPYLKVSQEPDDDQFVVTTLREGDIVQIEAIHFLKEARGRAISVWYQIRWGELTGWIRDSYLDSYDTKEKAETGSKMLLDRGNAS